MTMVVVKTRNIEPTPKAFLRWVGGKRLLVHRLLPYLPPQLSDRRYHEPFAGAANLFFTLAPRLAIVSDLNMHLIECYKQVRDNYERVAVYIREHERQNSEKYFYAVRDKYNRLSFGPAQAARFIYLNHTCFNGVFRVNRKGAFNVPYGNKPKPAFPSSDDLGRASKALRNATLSVADYEKALSMTLAGDFVYLDPPYPPLNGTSYFTHYTTERFVQKDQERLAAVVHDLNRRGILFLMSNADLPQIRLLYVDFNIRELSVMRYVSCKGTRYKVNELVITNY